MFEYKYLIAIAIIVFLYYLYIQQPAKLYWFYRSGCPHCDNMEGEWLKVENTIKCATRINITDPKHAEFVSNFSIDSVPQIIKIKPNGMRYTYEGDRKAINIVDWYMI